MKVVLQNTQGSAESEPSTQILHGSSTDHGENTPDAPVLDSSSVSISSDKSRKITPEDVQIVQTLVERCLQSYMNRDEVVNTLLHRARIDPGFTALVWQKLEEENADFFNAYNTRLMLQKQIILFNQLLEEQYNLMRFPTSSKDILAAMETHEDSFDPAECEIVDISMGYPVAQYPPIPSAAHPGIESIGTPGGFHPLAINSNDFTSMRISGLSVCGSFFSSHMTSSEALQMGPDAQNPKQSLQPFAQMPWNSQLAADLTNVEVEEFFADNVSELDDLLDEDKS